MTVWKCGYCSSYYHLIINIFEEFSTFLYFTYFTDLVT